tara:strand:+ start:445 stop:981 length:537 start_codon:yes stop_codon:yes gene_type:complete
MYCITKILQIKSLLILAILTSPLIFAEANICLTDFQEKLPENSIKKIKEMRIKAFKHCLECGTTTCKLKKWNAANKPNQTVCNRLFCKPTKTSKVLFTSNENHGYGITQVKFTYSLNQTGRIKNIVLKDVKGKMDKKRALIYLEDNLKLLRYEPIKIDGKSYNLIGLEGSTGWNIKEG